MGWAPRLFVALLGSGAVLLLGRAVDASPIPEGPVFHFNEGSGTTAADATGNGYDGTLAGGAGWTADAAFGNALDLAGNNGYVETGITQAMHWPLSVEAWVKTDQTTGDGGIVNKYASGSYNGFQVFMHGGDLAAWYLSTSQHTVRTDGIGDPDLSISDGAWHHTVTVFDSAGITHYVDGSAAASRGWSAQGPAYSTETTPLRVGTYPNSAGGPTRFFDGIVDEVAVYGRALTAQEAAARYTSGPPQPPAVPNPDGLILNLNEFQGGTTPDGLPGGHQAQVVNATVETGGKFGRSLSFDGSGDYVETDLTAAVAPPLTVEGWFRTTDDSTHQAAMINKYAAGSGQGFQTFVEYGELGGWYYDGSNNARIDGTEDVADGQWHHHAAVWDGDGMKLYLDGQLTNSAGWTGGTPGSSSETTPLRLATYADSNGNPGGQWFDGSLDAVAMYQRALSADEIAARYGDGPPLPEAPLASRMALNLDEGAGTTTYDKFNLNDATLYSDGSPSDALWTADGKFGAAVELDSAHQQYVQTQLTEPQPVPLTVEAWVKIDEDIPGSHYAIVNKYASGSYEGFQLFSNGGNLAAWYYTPQTNLVLNPTAPINDDTWHHAVAVFEADGGRLYLDGQLIDGGAWTNGVGMSSETTPLTLGHYAGTNRFLDGSIDEVALYSRALTGDEVMARFLAGPVSVPEPGSLALLSLGVLGLAAVRGRTARRSRR
jgi:hypothetical protein